MIKYNPVIYIRRKGGFAEKSDADVIAMPNGEHWFYTEDMSVGYVC